MTTWEDVQVPRGAYLGWGAKKGQHVTGKVLEYSPDGGTTFAGDPCPSATIELTEKAASFNKDGERTDHDAGTIIQLNAGQVSLKRALRAADPNPGDLIKITLVNLAKTDKGSVKEFDIKIARGSANSAKPKAAQADPLDDDEPPF
jgi:hypothetical protein